MSHEIAGLCKCQICGRTFAGPTSLVLGSGLDQTNNRVAQFSMKLVQHLMEAHPEANRACEMKALEFLGMMRLANYQTTDKAMLEQRDYLRWQIHQQTLAGTLSDEKLEGASADFAGEIVDLCIARLVIADPEPHQIAAVTGQSREGLTKEAALKLAEILRSCRDIIQEPGRYTVQPVGEGPGKPDKVAN